MSTLPNYKDILELIKKGATLEAQEQIVLLREVAVERQDENHDLKIRIRELEKALSFSDELEFMNQFYWKSDDETPFCPRCWEKEKIAIHVSPRHEAGYIYVRRCPECKTEYNVGDTDVSHFAL